MKLYTSKSVASFLDISERRVRQLRDEGIIEEHKSGSGLYDLAAANRRYINYLRKQNPGNAENIDYNAERAQLVRAKRLNEEYELQLKEKTLHSSEDVEKIMTDMLINFKNRLMAVPAKMSPVISKKNDKAEIYSLLKEQIDEALNELADYSTAFGNNAGKEVHADENANG